MTASSTIYTFVAANANDDKVTTYWEGGAGTYPNTLTVALGANASVNSIVLKLNPDSAWATRTQTIEVLGREQNATAFTSLSAATVHTFNPASANTVTIPVTATVAEVQLKVTTNSGSSGGQIAEFQVFGVAAPNPDLTITGLSWSPQVPVETDTVTVSATGQQRRYGHRGRNQDQLLPGNDPRRHRQRRHPGRRRHQHRLGQPRRPRGRDLRVERDG